MQTLQKSVRIYRYKAHLDICMRIEVSLSSAADMYIPADSSS